MSKPVAAMMRDGKRLHCHYGPIDLVIQAHGDRAAVERAYQAAVQRFEPVLAQLVDELPTLRTPIDNIDRNAMVLNGPVAKRMLQAVHQMHDGRFVTPMAAVAGAVADHVLAAMVAAGGLTQAYVNNGGDIAIWLAHGRKFSVALCDDPKTARLAGKFTISAQDKIGGIATSGWRGRSLSLGIADAVTVTARCAADADVAATLIANAVDLPGHPQIARAKASDQDPDSDLGEQPVTIGVGQLSDQEIQNALGAGGALAQSLIDRQLISNVALSLCQRVQVCASAKKISEESNAVC